MLKWQLLLFPLFATLLLNANGSSKDDDTDDDDDASADDTDDVDTNDDDDTDADDADADKDDEDKEVTAQQKMKRGFQALIDKHAGSAKDAAWTLYRERYRDREARRQLRLDNDRLRQQLPGKGRTVLPTRDANELQQYRALGKLSDVQTQLSEAATLKQRMTEREQRDKIAEAAEVVGYNARVLADVGGKLAYTVEDTQKDGKTVKVAYVVRKDGDQTVKTPLTEYAESNWAHHLPSLTGTTSTKTNARKVAVQNPPVARSDTNSRQGVAGSLISRRYAVQTAGNKQEK